MNYSRYRLSILQRSHSSKNSRSRHAAAAFLLASLLATCTGAIAADTQEKEPSSSTTLKGGVVETVVSMDRLEDARLSINRVRKAAANLYDEVNRQQMRLTSVPNVVGSTVLTVNSVSMSGVLLPPRKKWINASMSEISPIIQLFKEDVDTAIENNQRNDVSEPARKKLDPLREESFALVKQSFDTYKQLQGLTDGSNYDRGAISAATKNLDSSMRQLDRSLKKAISIIQKDAKSSKKA